MAIHELARRIWMLVKRDRVDRDLQREMPFHLQMLAEDHRDAGADAREARDAARRAFGNELSLREASRDAVGHAHVARREELAAHARHLLGSPNECPQGRRQRVGLLLQRAETTRDVARTPTTGRQRTLAQVPRQQTHDLWHAERLLADALERIPTHRSAA